MFWKTRAGWQINVDQIEQIGKPAFSTTDDGVKQLLKDQVVTITMCSGHMYSMPYDEVCEMLHQYNYGEFWG